MGKRRVMLIAAAVLCSGFLSASTAMAGPSVPAARGCRSGCNINSIARAEAFFPSSPTPDELWLDFYATAMREEVHIDQMITLAKNAGISAGLAEWGWHAGKTLLNPMTLPWWNLYIRYLTHLASEGDLQLGSIYFNDSPGQHPINSIGSASDPRIPGIRQVASAIKSAS